MKRYILAAVLAIIGIVGIKLYQWYEDKHEVRIAPVLKDNEKEKVIVKGDKLTKVRRNKDGGQEVTVERGVRDVVTVIDRDGTLSTHYRTWGFIHELGAFASFGDEFRGGLDIQWFYWRRLGLNAGIATSGEDVRGYLAVSHTIPINFLSNTSLFVGVDNKKELLVGARVRL